MGKVLEFDNWKRFCKYIGNHVLGWTIDEIDRVVLNTKLDEVISNINMLCACMELIFRICQYNS